MAEALARVEELQGRRFGDPSGPAPGVGALGRRDLHARHDGHGPQPRSQPRDRRGAGSSAASDARFLRDAYRRLLTMYGDVVLGVRAPSGSRRCSRRRAKDAGVETDAELSRRSPGAGDRRVRGADRGETGAPFPQDPHDQLWGGIGAVFDSWDNPRARDYRRLNHLPDDMGTAVNVQAMVFGNRGPDCATGVAFTRNPATGEKAFYGEYLVNAQGEDVVAGIRTPQPIGEGDDEPGHGRGDFPEAHEQLLEVARTPGGALRRHAGPGVHHRGRPASTCSRPAPASAPARRRCGSPSTWWTRG